MKIYSIAHATLISLICIATTTILQAQPGQRGPGSRSATGSIYGKVLDSKTGKPVEFAPVQLFATKFDSVTRQNKETVAGGQLTVSNGDFSIENVPVGNYNLKVLAMGYQKLEMPVRLQASPGQNVIAKDLGNIRLRPDSHLLKEVVVDGTDPGFRLEMDKKVYNVDQNPVNSGQTAQEVLRNVPSVNVDLDGNVTLRNAAPQIFVDGRPTTLTLDQIPSDAIENIELITNPSAKYDASSGMGGIINIVMKKNRKIGYNGSIRAGVDMRGRLNGGGDFNIHQGKFNVFLSTMMNQRYSIGNTIIERDALQSPFINVDQTSDNRNKRFFGLVKTGFDYFMDNRNTLTFWVSGHKGEFNMDDELNVRSELLNNGSSLFSSYLRESDGKRAFQNLNSSLQFKHLFPKEGNELTADVTVSTFNGKTATDIHTINYDGSLNQIGNPVLQQTRGGGTNVFTTAQTDYTDVFKNKVKFEAGLRATVKTFESVNRNYYFNYIEEDYIEAPGLTTNFRYIDQVFAGYTTLSSSFGKLNAQAGLRAESSDYSGQLPDSNLSFRVAYPVSFFPSGFVSYKLSETSDVQLTYSRKINRPGFFQLMPFTDYSDSLNYSRGNPVMKPEFINAFELSWQKSISRGNSVMVSAYHKTVSNMFTNYQLLEYNAVFDEDVIINTFANAKFGRAYGAEITTRNTFARFIELTLNFNLYNSEIDATNISPNLKNEQLSWFAKGNVNFRLPKNFTYQVSGDLQSKTAVPNSRGGGGGMGGGWGTPTSSVQGYSQRGFELDMALRYDFLKNRAASVTLAVSDLLRTEVHQTYIKTDFFEQRSERRRDQRFFRLNFSYRFGKMDVNLFRRKNNRSNQEGMDMGM